MLSKLIRALAIIGFLATALPPSARADTFYFWRYRTHATDCTLLTDGKPRDLCYEEDAQTIYKCVPTAGDCSGSEWKLAGGGSETNNLETIATGIQTTEIPIGTAANTVVYAPLSGDATMTNAGVITIGSNAVALGADTTGNYAAGDAEAGNVAADKVLESSLKAVDAAVDEDILTYEATTGDFEWHTGAELCVAITGSAGLCDGSDDGAGGATAWDAIGDAAADGTIALAGFETDFTSTLDSAGKAIMTITNTDADTAADTDFISLAHNDGGDANIFYFRAVGDLDGTPQTDYRFSQTAALIRPDLTVTGDVTITGDDLFMATNTSGAILVADGTNFNPVVVSGDLAIGTTGTATVQANAVALTTDTTGNYVLDVADGTGIDGTAAAEGATYTPTLDLTEIASLTWGAGTFTTMTFDAGAVDPVLTAASDNLNLTTGNFTVGATTGLGALAVDGGSDEIQLLIQGNGTQTSSLVTFENSAGTDMFTVSNTGTLVAADTITAGGTAQSTIKEGLVVNNDNGTDEDDDFTVKASGGTYEVDAGDGTFRATTNDMGWTVQAVANQACTTTCTSACVFGEDTSVLGSFVSCSDATADRCLCAGTS